MERIISNLNRWPIVSDLSILDKIETELETAKKTDCSLASEYWYLQQFYLIREMYLKIFKKLQEFDFYDAWVELAQIENIIIGIKHHYEIPESYSIDRILDIVLKIQKLYPYKWFTSREEIIEKMTCSICGKIVNPMDECGHLAGRVYCGEQCSHTIERIHLIAIAMVENPLDKYAVITPQGIEHNYALLEYLMNGISDPFQEWNYRETKRLKTEFKSIGMKHDCPCGSGKRFKRCCFAKNDSWMPHIEFIITNPRKPLGPDVIITDGPWK